MKMALAFLKCLFFVSAYWTSTIHCYSIQRIDNENGQPVNYEIDFYSTYHQAEVEKRLKNLETINLDSYRNRGAETNPPVNSDSTPLDSWSVVWYIASFGGLIIFFLIVSCSEWCCRRAIRNSQNYNNTNNTATASTPTVPDTPPPSYDQFAPPSYESICLGRNGRGNEKSEYDIFVVPVHALGTIMDSRETREDAPPSYLTASNPNFVPACPLTRELNQDFRVT